VRGDCPLDCKRGADAGKGREPSFDSPKSLKKRRILGFGALAEKRLIEKIFDRPVKNLLHFGCGTLEKENIFYKPSSRPSSSP
jgi:hypothetical protein